MEAKKGKKGVIHPELSYEIMGAAFEVHNVLGPGFMESLYEETLARELKARNVPFERQKEVTVVYKGQTIGSHRLDMVVDGKVVLELKAVSELTDAFKQQVLSYLKATGLRLGILINFGTSEVRCVRIAN